MLNLNFKVAILFFLIGTGASAQTGWTWTELDTMPMRISNNAVCSGTVSGEDYVYSFGGIDTSKIWSGISNRSFRYHVASNTWEEIDTLPVVLPLIASSASTVNNKIYIIGGYHVYSTGSEISSDEVVIYNPETNTYEANGTPIPTPIDDQVQCVWRDSLIFVITGWSNTTNVPKVQIYDPALDQWQAGTDTPNNTSYKVFGGSGEIIGDTIYYFGGASTGWNFPAKDVLRKGVIDPADPTQITWTLEDAGPNQGYRQACLKYDNALYWVGGSSTSYNYNGIAYNGTGGVSPLFQIMRYEAYHTWWNQGLGAPYGVMDLRGAGQVSPTEWIICGGMEDHQKVSNRTYLLTFDPIVGSLNSQEDLDLYISDRKVISNEPIDEILIYSLDGKLLIRLEENLTIPDSISGLIILEIHSNGTMTQKKVIL